MIRHHTLIYFASRLSSAAANLAAVAIFTRLAASHVYGGSLLVFSWTYVVFGFSGQWLGATFFAVQQPTAVPAQVATLGRLALAALTASALVVAAVAATGGVGWPFAGVVVVAVSAQLVFVTVTEVERTLLEAGRVSVMYLLRAALILAFGSIALLSGGGALDLALAISVANLLAALPGLIRLAPALIGPTDRATLASFVRYGWPLVLAFGAMGLGQNIDRLVLAHVAGTGSLGPYGATSDFLKQGFGVVCEAITLAAVSVAKDAATRGDRETARRLLEDSFRALVVTVAFGTVFILTFSNDFINVIFGPDFRATAHDLMPWLIAANAALVIRAFYFGQAIYFGQSSTNELLGAGSMIAVTAGLAFALVPGFGIYGAALAATGGQISACVVYAAGRPRMPIPWASLGTILLAAAAAFALTLALRGATGLGVPARDALQSLVMLAAVAAVGWRYDILEMRGAMRFLSRRPMSRPRPESTRAPVADPQWK